MKYIIALLMAAVITGSAAETSWLNSVSLAPIGAVRMQNITGPSEYGAGIDLGVGINPFVSLHIANLAFEGPGQTEHKYWNEKTEKWDSYTTGPNSWGGSTIDETDIYVKAKIARFSTESFFVYGIAGGLRDWERERWGLSVGAGVELALNKRFSVAGDYSVRAYTSEDASGSSRDSLIRALVNFKF